MATRLSDDQLNEIDDALATGTALSVDTAFAISRVYGVWAAPPAAMLPLIEQRYNHPTVGPTGRRALDALKAFIAARDQ
jgi:hypothetical protein